MGDLSKAVFKAVLEDREAVENFHSGSSRQAMGAEQLQQKGEAYWRSKMRRMIRNSDDLKDQLQQLLAKYAEGQSAAFDPSTGKYLLTEYTQQVLEAVFELIDKGSFCGKCDVCLANRQLYVCCSLIGN